MPIQIRKARSINDFAAAHALIRTLAIYEKAEHEHNLSLQQFTADGLAGSPLYFLFLAEKTEDDGSEQPEIVGITLCYFCYSTWKGKMLYLDDLVIAENYRHQGIGRLLVNNLIRFAKAENAQQLRWHVLNWNTTAIEFYQKLGMKLENDWVTCKLEKEQLDAYDI